VRKLLLRAAAIGAVLSGTLMVLPGTAMAFGASRTCATPTCSIDASGFPGGQISVDADTHGIGNSSWVLFRIATFPVPVCSANFAATDPPRSWVCNSLPAGSYVASVSGPAGPTNIGIRW
jgi:hypothetical protein